MQSLVKKIGWLFGAGLLVTQGLLGAGCGMPSDVDSMNEQMKSLAQSLKSLSDDVHESKQKLFEAIAAAASPTPSASPVPAPDDGDLISGTVPPPPSPQPSPVPR